MTNTPSDDETYFLAGCVGVETLQFFAKESRRQAREEGFSNSYFFARNESDWAQFNQNVGWPCIAMATVKPADTKRAVVGIGVHGQWWEAQPATLQEWRGTIENVSGHLRCLRSIGSRIYAAGMGRSVWQRNDVGGWHSIGPAPLASDAVIVGFEDIDGFGEDELYAVGWLGDVWCRKNGVWNRIASPVSTNLHAVCCASDGFVYAVGSGGVMIKGRGDSWTVLATGWDADLMDVAEHAGQIIVVTNFTILTLVGEALVREQNFATDDLPRTCLSLETGPGVVLSIGPNDVFKRTDGSWSRVPW